MSFGPNNPDPMNPYQSSQFGGTGMPGSDHAAATAKVKAPAIGLLVTGVLGIPGQVGVILYSLALGSGALLAPPDADPQAVEMMKRFGTTFGAIGLVMGVIGILVAILVIFGALKMMKLESYGLAMTSSILAIIPCISACCLLGLPFGIWALVALNDANVKASFR